MKRKKEHLKTEKADVLVQPLAELVVGQARSTDPDVTTDNIFAPHHFSGTRCTTFRTTLLFEIELLYLFSAWCVSKESSFFDRSTTFKLYQW